MDSRARTVRTLTALLLICCAAEAAGAEPGRYALLVGCTEYPALDRSKWLTGPENDVALMRQHLKDRHHFVDGDITVLVESAGREEARPIRANIAREFRRLAAACRPGDRVVILLSGHGTQQPDARPDPHNDPEPDGLDEVFLPADIGAWNAARQTITNAIVDDDLRGWLADIQRAGAHLWLIVDSCHSGTMIRGIETVRRIEPRDLGVPARIGSDRSRDLATRGDVPTSAGAFDAPPAAPGMVAIYAAQPNEPTIEKELPQDGPPARTYGLLTYSLVKVLNEAGRPLTYRQLVERIYLDYAAMGRRCPSPMIEGAARNEQVLGEGTPDIARIRLGRDHEGRWMIDAGAVHGLTAGTILAVSAPAGEGRPEEVVGHVRIGDRGLGAMEAAVEPCSYPEGTALPASVGMIEGGLCRVVFYDLGERRIRVAIDDKDGTGRTLSPADLDRLARLLGAIGPDGARPADGPGRSPARVVSDPSRADWLIHAEEPGSRTVYLVPASGVSQADGDRPASLFGPVPTDPRQSGPWLRDRLARIAAARGLIKAADTWDYAPGRPRATGLEVDLLRFASKADEVGVPVEPTAAGIELRRDDLVGFRLKNSGREPVDVTLLLIDSEYGITSVFPTRSGLDNRIWPGKSFVTDRFWVTVDLPGQEHLVVIAEESRMDRPPSDFGFLEQPSIERARAVAGVARGAGDALDSPLGQFLLNVRHDHAGCRGLAREDHGGCDLSVLTWRTAR